MANVLVNSTSVNKEMRNRRNYGNSSLNNVVNSGGQLIPINKQIIAFNRLIRSLMCDT